jgi:hypothetical protein
VARRGDDVVVLDLNGSGISGLNGSARVLWERLVEPCTDADLAALLVERFDISDERAHRCGRVRRRSARRDLLAE